MLWNGMRDIRVNTNIPRIERCGQQCACSVLRLEQLHVHKGDSQTPPTNTTLVVRHC